MGNFDTATLITTIALVGVVIIIAALLSGVIERSEFPQVAVFLGLGAAFGPIGLGFIDVQLSSPVLRVVATLSLTLVLFTDALNLDTVEVRRNARLALLLLGPGTLLTALIVGVSAWWLLGLSPAAAAILGAALASTDPVLLRGILRRRDVPSRARLGLRLESGLNDVVLLPIVVVAMTLLSGGDHGSTSPWGRVILELLLLGPGAGVLVGVCAVATMDLVRRRIGVRRDYEALYALGVAFTAYAAAEAVHGSGFLAAFAAGLAITALDVELCDCFLEYGETTAEMALLLTFVLLGSSLIWTGLSVISWTMLLFAAIALFIRLPIYLISLARTNIDQHARRLVAWFGPRGLSSLLLVLLPIFAGIPGSEALFPICCLIVLFSVVIHGSFPILLTQKARIRRERASSDEPPNESPIGTAPAEEAVPFVVQPAPQRAQPIALLEGPMQPLRGDPSDGVARPRPETTLTVDDTSTGVRGDQDRITLEAMQRLQAAGAPVTILDVRTDRSYNRSDVQMKGAIRMPPDHVVERARELHLAPEGWLIGFCT